MCFSLETALGMFKNGFDLPSRDTRKPGEEFIDARAAFEVLEQGFYRHARSTKYPRTADYARRTLDRGAR